MADVKRPKLSEKAQMEAVEEIESLQKEIMAEYEVYMTKMDSLKGSTSASAMKKIPLALKKVPTLYKDCITGNELLSDILSKTDIEALEFLESITSKDGTLTMNFKPGNKLFKNTALTLKLGVSTSGIQWCPNMSPSEKNKAEGKTDTSEDAHCSIFELFEGLDVDDSSQAVFLILTAIALDPVSVYLGKEPAIW
eukprot:TRINITY_DN9322_c0_g4_i2.p1 TRINITY_DN9322_c0_g4~~TRINITY_DN9322_c0_g4_i2.p1  ORF type:complete len:195 (+),score=43.45 TRINITY_DN9322_c0_g4_i2:39-623(+)